MDLKNLLSLEIDLNKKAGYQMNDNQPQKQKD
jgi:hypothetical protein